MHTVAFRYVAQFLKESAWNPSVVENRRQISDFIALLETTRGLGKMF